MPTPSLFRADDRAALVQRLRRLPPDARPQWGKMDVGQMLAHCQVPLTVAVGDRTIRRGVVGLLFGRMAKKKLAGDTPFGRSLPTNPEFVVADRRVFDRERDALVDLVQRFGAAGAAGRLAPQHPFFGPLTPAEWDVLMWKHLDHHLRQFGAT